MGMFDLLRGKLKKFTKSVEEEVAKDLPPEPEPPKAKATLVKPDAKPAAAKPEPLKSGKSPTKPLSDDSDFDEDLERELAAIEAEVDAERRGEPAKPVAQPAKPALAKPEPATPAGKVEPARHEPAKTHVVQPLPPPPSAKRQDSSARSDAPKAEAPRLEAPRPMEVPKRGLEAPEAAVHAPPSMEPKTPAPSPFRAAAPPSTMAPPPKAAPKPAPPPPKKTGGTGIKPERVEELLWDLELMLLEADIAVPVVEAIKERMQESLPNLRVNSTSEVQPAVEEALKDALRDVMSSQVMDFDEFILNAKKPVKIMFVGINGTGKTTTIARIAHRLKQNGYSSVLAAGDTFRAGAIEQIGIHSDRLGITVIKHAAGADPAAVAHDAIQHALSRRKDVVLIDTAGRMQTNINLMAEMQKIKRVSNPDLIVFVGDALAGNDAVEQAKKFDETIGITAAVLTKVDTDSKGGAALSIAHAVGKPILFLGVGQEYDDLIPFDPDWVISRIFGEA